MNIVALVSLLMLAGSPAPAADPWEKAIKRLPPSAFPQLPRRTAAYLTRRGCLIPQAWSKTRPHNVVRGEFIGRGVKSWAVLCSRTGRSAILVFDKDGRRPVAELAAANDLNWVQTVSGDGRVGYSRIVSAVGRREIIYYRDSFGGPLPRRIDHQGIEDYFDGKASVIHYFESGRWLELTGMD